MAKRALIAATLLIVICGSLGSAGAAGVYDGIWVVTISSATDSTTHYVSINENDSFLSAGFNVVMLSVRFGHGWGAATAILSGTLAYGSLYDSTPAPTASFTITFTDVLHFSGSGTIQGAPVTLTGVRVF